MLRRLRLLAVIPAAACGSNGTVELAGQFTRDVPPPQEIRVMLDPHYAHLFGEGGTHDGDPRAYVQVFPSADGFFSTGPIPVRYPGKMTDPPPPTFFVGFGNEKDVLYAIGERSAALTYRTYDAATRERVPRSEVCWKLVSGAYEDAGRRAIRLSLVLAPNFDVRKWCLPEGNFTPLRLDQALEGEE